MVNHLGSLDTLISRVGPATTAMVMGRSWLEGGREDGNLQAGT